MLQLRVTKSRAGMEALFSIPRLRSWICRLIQGTIDPRVTKACPPQCVTGVITDSAKRLGPISKPTPCQQRDLVLVPPTDPMDPTAVEICAADFQILLVEATFCQCRFTPRTGVSGLAWLPFGTPFSTPMACQDHFLLPRTCQS